MRAFFSTYGRLIVIGVLATVLLVAAGVLVYRAGYAAGDPPAGQGNTSVPPTLQPGEKPEVNQAAVSQTWLSQDGKYIDAIMKTKKQWQTYKNGDGYLIPRADLTEWANGGALLFEGEQQQRNTHDVMLVIYADGTFAPVVGDNGLALRNQGSFWAYPTKQATSKPDGYDTADDLLMVFANAKREGWKPQGISLPIRVWLSTGTKVYQPSDPITLTQSQTNLVNTTNDQRCTAGSQPREENPFGVHDSGSGMISALGSYTCDTLIIRGNTANWWRGAMDNVPYTDANQTHVFIVPQGWGTNEIAAWVKQNYPSATFDPKPLTKGSTQ